MDPKVDKAIRYSTGTCLIVFFFAYLFFDQEWAHLPFAISLLIVSLYSLLFIRAKKE
jgi:hypothetical protein